VVPVVVGSALDLGGDVWVGAVPGNVFCSVLRCGCFSLLKQEVGVVLSVDPAVFVCPGV
jgi:hypothetical protein